HSRRPKGARLCYTRSGFSMADDSLDSLVQRATQGDSAAVDELLVRHLPGLRAYVRLHSDPLLRERESCSDLVQSVCRRVLGDIAGFDYRGEAAFRSWLFQKAHGKILDRRRYWLAQRRDAKREERQPAEFVAAFCTPSQAAIGKETMQRLEGCFDRLPED